jgi:hypothetical protein
VRESGVGCVVGWNTRLGGCRREFERMCAVCCIYHKPKEFGESSSESGDDSGDDDGAGDEGRLLPLGPLPSEFHDPVLESDGSASDDGRAKMSSKTRSRRSRARRARQAPLAAREEDDGDAAVGDAAAGGSGDAPVVSPSALEARRSLQADRIARSTARWEAEQGIGLD